MAVEIPVPAPGDSENVISSLQNAALFGRIGHAQEALRWLQRAAESAADADDDARTLALARCVAELSGAIRAGLESVPPAASTKAVSAGASASVAPLAASDPSRSRPPPPSSRASGAPRPSLPSRAPLTSLSKSSAPRDSKLPRPRELPSRAPTAKAVSTPAAPRARPAAPSAERPTALRQAARVSVTRSASDPGLYLVRLLEEGNSADAGSVEALLVSLDPSARPFTS